MGEAYKPEHVRAGVRPPYFAHSPSPHHVGCSVKITSRSRCICGMPRAARGVSYGGDTLCVARPEGVSFVLLMTPSAARLALSPAAPFDLFAEQRI